jgi:hypothetical protein
LKDKKTPRRDYSLQEYQGLEVKVKPHQQEKVYLDIVRESQAKNQVRERTRVTAFFLPKMPVLEQQFPFVGQVRE